VHRDQKIGLSLAVLVIGFAGAFCFRNEPLNEARPLALDQVAALDARIEQLPIRAYTEREGVRLSEGDGELQSPETDNLEPFVGDTPVTAGSDPLAKSSGDLVDLFAGPPEPLQRESPVEADVKRAAAGPRHTQRMELVLPDSVPTDPGNSLAVGEAAEFPHLTDPEGSAATAERTYVVRSGDTLIGISAQMYGASTRYLDLYRANRDILANPNDLRVGMTLRIP